MTAQLQNRLKGINVLITGGLGFIGSFMVDRLVAEGHKVRIFDNLDQQVHPDGIPAHLSPAAELRIGDVRDRSALASALEDVDAVVHCAAAVGVAQSLYRVHHCADVNVGGTALLLELLAQHRRPLQKLLIFTSMTSYGEGLYWRTSDGVPVRIDIRTAEAVQKYGWEPVWPATGEILSMAPTPEVAALLARNVYALTKRYQEELALSLGQVYGFPVVCLRLFNVYGPRQSLSNPYTGVLAIFLSRLRAGERPVVYEDGTQTRDFVSVHDVVHAAMLALQRSEADGQVINIGSGAPRRIGDCASTLAYLLGRPDLQPLINYKFRNGDIRHCTADISKAARVLGYKPSVQWEEGLTELIEWARSAPTADHFDRAERELRERGLVK
jgi:dTDP-L-rhamnose 4-epimerase